jgi:hypothetical protein
VGPQGEISGAEAKLRAALVQKDVLEREVRVEAPRARCPGARAPERALRACGRGPGACVSRAGGCPKMSAPVASVVRRPSLTARGGRRLR